MTENIEKGSGTPRTDGEVYWVYTEGGEAVDPDFARTLETELTAAIETVKVLEQELSVAHANVLLQQKLGKESESRLSAAVEENARLKDDGARRDETVRRYEQLDVGLYPQEKRRLDWLIQALESPPWANFWYSGTPDYLTKARVIIDSALAGEG